MIVIITERVMVSTRTDAQDTKPPLLKFLNPALIILLSAVIYYSIISTSEEQRQCLYLSYVRAPLIQGTPYRTYLPSLSSLITFPFSIVTTLLLIESTTPLLWVVRITVVPRSFIFLKIWITSWVFIGSRFPVGSSAMMSSGWLIMALAIARRCC